MNTRTLLHTSLRSGEVPNNVLRLLACRWAERGIKASAITEASALALEAAVVARRLLIWGPTQCEVEVAAEQRWVPTDAPGVAAEQVIQVSDWAAGVLGEHEYEEQVRDMLDELQLLASRPQKVSIGMHKWVVCGDRVPDVETCPCCHTQHPGGLVLAKNEREYTTVCCSAPILGEGA